MADHTVGRRDPHVIAAVQRCYRLGAAYRAATDPVDRADIRTSMADAVAALQAARAATKTSVHH